MNDCIGEADELSRMSRTAGWEILRSHLEKQIEARLKELEQKSFTSLDQVTRLQGEIQGLRAPLIFLQDRQRRAAALQKEDK